ncbi:3-oxoacyl-ACP synthase III family protein [Nonlabens sp. Asnod2-A12]|uniref:3-oxoacyl-ACP synthase III family protein n=1 Tax=Nonlabens sp. Asnod2-A12 TaxID=3160578 RepID=UPI00386F2B89
MIESYINHISYYLPEKILTNEDLATEFPEWSVEKIAKKIGINERHIAGEDETSLDMGVKAANQLFEEYGVQADSIDYLLFCTQSPDYFLPTSACIIQDKLGLRKSCGALDFNLGCSGFIYGLSLAKGLVASGIAKKVLLVCGETYSKFLNKSDKGNRTIFGDAASATLISSESIGLSAKIGQFDLGTDGSGAENLIVKAGGMRQPELLNEEIKDDYGNTSSDADLFMNGPEIFNFTSLNVPKLVENNIQKNELDMDDIQHFVFHQANAYMLNHLRKKIKVEKDRFPVRMDFCGNTVSSTIQIALRTLQDENSIKSGEKILLAGFGVGYSWGAVTIELK